MEKCAKVEVALVAVTVPRDERPDTVSEVRVPTLVKEEPTTAEPRVVASKTRALLMRKTPPVGTFTFPVVRVMPPAKEEVALEPLMVVVAEPFPTVS